ncbi:GNAT family N-acetyltransferase [Enterovirga rhinocerotis]|uniref:Putative N-acetyltransferase YhbS n=1 Tax=Enterovirga rhinocerotis TaxID=1339210 RepID=A0A4R7BTD5_9HYPH|nr:N-acetyltransferase [Enterovirga rhinocerotis]TDR87266.1 putative N-acetyltransferase YhbS [Enterovirga rhinocerotis]
MTTLPLSILPERPEDAAPIERLHERAFGPGRFARTAFRLREGAEATPELCFTALVGTLLVGSIRLSPISLGEVPGLLLGPLAVDPAFEGRGIGAALIGRSLERAKADGHRLVILVGDEPYYARFGFARAPAGRLQMPAPVDPARLLAAELEPGALDGVAGQVVGRRG